MGITAINISSTTPGTPKKVYQPGTNNPTITGHTQIQADPSNAGKLYIGTAGLVKGATPATRFHVLAVLAAGDMWPSGSGMYLNPEFLFFDVDTAGDGLNGAISG